MNDGVHDPVLRRAIDELQRLPETDPAAVRRVIEAAATARVSPADSPAPADLPHRSPRMRVWSVAGMAAAAAIVGFVARGAWVTRTNVDPAAQPTVNSMNATSAQTSTLVSTSTPALRTMAGADASRMPVPQQFVIENPSAHRIAVVGDFNNWNPASAPMTRSPQGRLWSAEIPMLPGRHVYGFMVDDTLFVLDPRAPKARDPEFGAEGSVMLVGRP